MKKILAVFGTRPEAIKMRPLVLQLKRTKHLECIVCLTGQHREMLVQVMDAFGIQEDYNLDIMQQNQTLASITVNVLSRMENNRQAADLIAELYFAPTGQARQNLLKEGKKDEKIYVTGNTVIDALLQTVREDYRHEHLDWCQDSRLILLTAHRRENLGEPMRHMFRAVKRIIEEYPDIKVVYPVHKNPKVRQAAREILAGEERIRLIEPLDVVDFHNFMAHSYIILTDSGGIQEEAPSLGKPVLVMRDTTERPEGIEAGTLKLVGTEEERIYREIKGLLEDEREYQCMSRAVNPYGDGHASERIVRAIVEYWGNIGTNQEKFQ